MNRFFVKKEDILDGAARICGEDAHHITGVLRLAPGDEVVLCDGCGTDYPAVIENADKTAVTLRVGDPSPSLTEPRAKATLYQALPKAGKLETIIQKCVELGVNRIVPFAAARSVVRLTAAEFEKKRARYQRVAYEAAKQSRRGIVPEIAPLAAFCEISPESHGAFLFPYEEESATSLKAALRGIVPDAVTDVAFIIGPEGGFEPSEAETLVSLGAVSVSLGPRILRTETAGPAALAMILYELEQKA